MGLFDFLNIGRSRTPATEQGSPEFNSNGQLDYLQQDQQQNNPYNMVSAKAAIDYVEEEFKKRSNERMPTELQWRLNIAFMEGNQYVQINETARILDRVPEDYWWEQREVFNHIAPNIEARQARIGKMRPVLKVRPGSTEQKDIRATKVSSQLLVNIQQEQKIRDKLHEVIRWIELCGTVCLKNVWNPNLGPMIPKVDQQTGEPVVGENGKPVMIHEGDLDVVVCPAPEIYPDSMYNQKPSNCRSIIHAKIYPVSLIKDIWDIDVAPEATKAIRLQQLMTGGGFVGKNYDSNINESLKDTAIVKEYHEMPTNQYPQGRLIIVANGKLLHFGPLTSRVGPDGTLGLPFVKICCIERPGVFWGRTILERLIPLQRRYNALRNRKAEYLTSCAFGTWIVEENSVDINEMEANIGSPNFICKYKPGMTPPKKTDNPPLPSAFETEEQTILTEFSILSGVSEMSRQSKAPTGVKSGVALSLALEQDETRLADTANNIEEGLIEAGSQWLRYLKQYVKMPRLLRVAGQNNIVDVMDWTASDLKPEDVIMDSFSALSESPAQKRQMVFDLLGVGLFNNPDTGAIDRQARSKIMEMLQFFDWEGLDDEDQLHFTKAERENRIMIQGGFPAPVLYDSHVLHIRKHNEYRLTTEYEALARENPGIDNIITQHVYAHAMFLAQNQMVESEPTEQAEEEEIQE